MSWKMFLFSFNNSLQACSNTPPPPAPRGNIILDNGNKDTVYCRYFACWGPYYPLELVWFFVRTAVVVGTGLFLEVFLCNWIVFGYPHPLRRAFLVQTVITITA